MIQKVRLKRVVNGIELKRRIKKLRRKIKKLLQREKRKIKKQRGGYVDVINYIKEKNTVYKLFSKYNIKNNMN